MPELRQDPTTREWVIIAPERAKRPHSEENEEQKLTLPDWDETCPFCPGNEEETPPELFRIPSSDNDSSWSLRVVPNRFAALSHEKTNSGQSGTYFTRKMGGFGEHEVIIETPSHNSALALLPYEQVENLLIAYHERYNALKSNSELKFITIFKNYGSASGTSLAHPHSQLVASPIMTPYYHLRFDVAVDYYADKGSCLYCDMLAEELRAGERIVTETENYIVLNPYASRVPYETWIVPREHLSSFGMVPKTGLEEIAKVLKDTTLCLYRELDDPAFNLLVDTSIITDEDNPYYQWHIRIMPRLAFIAGFEMGSGIYINAVPPEKATELLKHCMGTL